MFKEGTQGVRTGKAPRGQSTYQTAHEQVEDSEARWKRGLQTPCLLLFPHQHVVLSFLCPPSHVKENLHLIQSVPFGGDWQKKSDKW